MRTLQIATQRWMNLKHTVIVSDRSLHDYTSHVCSALTADVSFKNHVHLSAVQLRQTIRESFQNDVGSVAKGRAQNLLNDFSAIDGSYVQRRFDAINRRLSILPPAKDFVAFLSAGDSLTELFIGRSVGFKHSVPKYSGTACSFLFHGIFLSSFSA